MWLATIFGIYVAYQIVKILLGGSWGVEDAILALVVLNITITFGMFSSLISLNNKLSKLDGKLHGHLEWHKGRDSKANL